MNHLRAFLVVVGILAFGWIGFRFWQEAPLGSSETTQETITIDQMEQQGLPGFSAKALDGREVRLQDHQGQVVIINFWASWCGPCVEEVPSLIKLVKASGDKVHLFAVSGDSSREDIEIFLKSFPDMKSSNIDIIWDQDHHLMKQYGVSKLPESFVSKKDLKLAKKLVGSIDWYTQDAQSYIQGLLK